MRGFEKVSKDSFLKVWDEEVYSNIVLPTRSTENSAGYDFYVPISFSLKPKEKKIIPTGIKAYMKANEVLFIVVRSSLGIKNGIRLMNQVGIIDSDYYNNQDNEGHILIALENTSDSEVKFIVGNRVVQGIFLNYLSSTNELRPRDKRKGGIGST